MKRSSELIVVLALTLSNVASAQSHSRGYSHPGRLQIPEASKKDTQPPVIILIEPASAVMRSTAGRSIKIIAEASDKIAVRGVVEDDGGVASLRINGRDIKLGGTATHATFGVRLKHSTPGSTVVLEFVAKDNAGNAARQLYEIQVPDAQGGFLPERAQSGKAIRHCGSGWLRLSL